jgi:hypothetical protein
MNVFIFVGLPRMSFCVWGMGREKENCIKNNIFISALLKAKRSRESSIIAVMLLLSIGTIISYIKLKSESQRNYRTFFEIAALAITVLIDSSTSLHLRLRSVVSMKETECIPAPRWDWGAGMITFNWPKHGAIFC